MHAPGQGTRVQGTAFEVTDAELAAADDYERDADYIRIAVVLASGHPAWVAPFTGPAPHRRRLLPGA